MVVAKRYGIEDIRESQDTNFLIDIFRNGNEEECKAAYETIVKLPETKYKHLMNSRNDSNENVRAWVARALARSGDTFFLPQLAGMLSDCSPVVREVVHEELKVFLSGMLADRNRAVHEFENGILSDALVRMLKGRLPSSRETAYAFLQEIFDEARIVDFLKNECNKAKGRIRKARIVHYLKRATHELSLLSCGISNQERKELREKGLVFRAAPESALPKGKLRLVN